MADLEGPCGPASASANGIWGPWSSDLAFATRQAAAQARAMAALLCNGKCTDAAQSCTYTETKASIDGTEERIVDGRTEYRVKASSSGTCSCK